MIVTCSASPTFTVGGQPSGESETEKVQEVEVEVGEEEGLGITTQGSDTEPPTASHFLEAAGYSDWQRLKWRIQNDMLERKWDKGTPTALWMSTAANKTEACEQYVQTLIASNIEEQCSPIYTCDVQEDLNRVPAIFIKIRCTGSKCSGGSFPGSDNIETKVGKCLASPVTFVPVLYYKNNRWRHGSDELLAYGCTCQG